MRSINLLIILLFVLQGCSGQKDIIGKSYNYHHQGKINGSIYNNTLYFESDTTLTIYGGKLAYKYSTHPHYKKLNDSTYIIYYSKLPIIKEVLTDTIMKKVQMQDVRNDTIYWKSDKEFKFRERIFKLYEYKDVPLEDQ